MIINVKKTFFYIAYICIVFITMTDGIVFFNSISDQIKFLIPISLIIVLLMQSKKYKVKSLIEIVLIGGIIFVSSIKLNSTNILYLYIFIIAFKDIEFEEFIKRDVFIKLLFISGIILLCQLNVIKEQTIYRNGIIRHSFGFPHPNTLGIYITMISLEIYYLLCNKKNKILYILLLFSIFFLYSILNSRTGIVIIVLLLILDIVNSKSNFVSENKFIKLIIPNIFIILVLMSIILGILYNNDNVFVKRLDEIINKRIYYPSVILEKYDINFWGNNIRNDKDYLIDNAYINLIINYGLLVTLVFSYLFNKSLNKMIIDKNYKVILIFLVLFIFGFSESLLYSLKFNPFLFIFSFVLNECSDGKECKK